MKKTITITLIAIAIIGGYFLFSSTKDASSPSDIQITQQANITSPARPAEVNGIVQSVEGNVIVLANEVGKEQLTEEERDARKEEMADMSQEERQLQRQIDLEEMETQDTEIIIPVGVSITKGSGSSDGDTVLAEISDIQKDTYLSIWMTTEGSPEFVKIKGIGQ